MIHHSEHHIFLYFQLQLHYCCMVMQVKGLIDFKVFMSSWKESQISKCICELNKINELRNSLIIFLLYETAAHYETLKETVLMEMVQINLIH